MTYKQKNEIAVPNQYLEHVRLGLINLNANFTYRSPIYIKTTYFTFKNVYLKNQFLKMLKWYLKPRRDIIKSLR